MILLPFFLVGIVMIIAVNVTKILAVKYNFVCKLPKKKFFLYKQHKNLIFKSMST